MSVTPVGEQRIRALRAFAYSLDGVRLIAVAPGETVSLRAGAAQGLIREGYAEPMAADSGPAPAGLLTPVPPTSSDTPTPRRRRASDRRN